MAIKVSGTEVISDDKRILNNESLPDIRPSLLLDFANSKTLDPRITFTRGSTATYWDGKTTAKAEENLFKYSQQVNLWPDKTNVTVIADDTTAPDGTTTADRITDSGSGDIAHYALTPLSINTSTTYSISCYIKYGSGNGWVLIGFSGGTYGVSFDVQNGVVGTEGSGVSGSSITDVGNGWYRCELQTSMASSSAYPQIRLVPSDNTPTYTADGSYVWAWGFQVEQRSSVTAYTPTTSSPIVKYQPVLQTASSGEARFDHDPVTGESKGLLIEEARTNLAPHGQTLDSGQWAKNNVTVTANVSVAPDGTLTADLMQQGTSTDYMIAEDYLTLSADTVYTASAFVKYAGDVVEFGVFDSTASHMGRVDFDASIPSISMDNGTDYGYEDVGNGWYRIWVTFTSGSTLTNSRIRYLLNQGQSGAGDGWSGAILWGAQLEQGSFPTSYIPTSGSTVTRAVDAAAITGSNFSSWYTQGQGTLFAEVDHFYTSANDNYPRSVSLYGDDINTDIIGFFYADAPSIPYYSSAANITYNGASQFDTGSLASSTKITGYHKNGLAFEANNFAVTSDGLTPQTDATGVVPYVTKLAMFAAGGYQPVNSGYVKKIAFYPKRLPNATLQAMTEE